MKKKIFVAVPTMGSITDGQPRVLRNLEKRYGDEIEFVYPKETVRRMFHDYARNAMVEEFLESDADILWFLDSDIVPPVHVLDLVTLHGDKWMVAGAPYPIFICPKEGDSPQVVIAVFNGTDGKGLCPTKIPYDSTAYVDGLATGCLFIKREVFSQLKKPYFEFIFDQESRQIREGEDLGFCRRMREMGHKFFVDYSMVCKHYKTVCLLDVNNYAIQYAQNSVLAYDAEVRPKIEILAEKLKLAKKSGPASPHSSVGSEQMAGSIQRIPQIIIPGHGSPFAQGIERK
jgi:hypothetical protein